MKVDFHSTQGFEERRLPCPSGSPPAVAVLRALSPSCCGPFFLAVRLLLATLAVSQPGYSQDLETQSQSHSPAEEESPHKSPAFLRLGKLDSPLIPESSGIVHCQTQPNAFWTINDSGYSADLYCVSLEGRVLAQLTLEAATNVDWESMSFFTHLGVRYLVIADVGDNLSRRKNGRIYYFPEPQFELEAGIVKKRIACSGFDFVYEDGPRDCEGVAVDPRTGDIYLVEKLMRPPLNRRPAGLYQIAARDGWWQPPPGSGSPPVTKPQPVANPRRLTARRVGDFPYLFVTGMNFSPDGTKLVVRNYVNAFLFQQIEGQNWTTTLTRSRPLQISLPLQRQGEAIAFTEDSRYLIITSETVGQPIWRIDYQRNLPQPTPSPTDDPKLPADKETAR